MDNWITDVTEDWQRGAVIQDHMANLWHTHSSCWAKAGRFDPNGFSYFDGKWSCFTKNFPFGAAYGLKIMGTNRKWRLVHFKTGVTLHLDSHGAYSDQPCSLVTNYSYSTPEMSCDAEWVRHLTSLWWIWRRMIEKWQNLDWSPCWLYGSLSDPTDLISKVNSYAIVGVKTWEAKDSSVSIYRR